jgi:seryl-tRNA synthetase
MLDQKAIRDNAAPFIEGLRKRNADTAPIDKIVEIDREWRMLKKKADDLKHERNNYSQQINEKKKAGDDVLDIIEKTRHVSNKIKELDESLREYEARIDDILLSVPNMPSESTPIGKDADENVEIRKWGEPAKNSENVRPHYELAELIGIDFDRGVKLAGSRFAVLKGQMARLERALAYYMLQKADENGYKEVSTPYVVNSKTMTGTGQLPKFSEDLYRLEDTDYWLIPTAEVPLTNLHSDEVLEEEDLTISYCAHTPCFRREAGNYQKDIKGLIRQHQFSKVELVKFAKEEQSFDELEKMTRDAQSVLEGLGLPYRVIELCTGDIGFSAAKTYDLEVWIPSQDTYREISSCSNCTDFQARRANIKYSRDGKNEFVHTLNGSGMAIGRTMISILENYQEVDGIRIPKVLQDFMQAERIEFEK